MSNAARLAPKKNLHDGRSIWADSTATTVNTRRLSKDISTEIVIVGCGISGALTALQLADDGHDIVMLDRREPGTGSTIASTAMIQFEIDTPLIKLAEQIGLKRAKRVYLRSFDAVEKLGALITRHGLKSAWTDRTALYLAGSEMGFRGLQDEADARRRIGLPSHYLDRSELADTFGIDRTGAIISNGAAELDPAMTCAAALRVAQRKGAVIYAPTRVEHVEQADRGLTVKVSDGPVVHARKVIFATGYEVVSGIPRDAFDIVSSWAIATKPVASKSFWPNRSLIWEASDPYLYMRATADDRILAGGEDSSLKSTERRKVAIPAKSLTLLRKLKALLARDDLEIDYAWAGAFAESPTGLPAFRPLPDLPGAYAILGCGGNGITFSVIASEIVARWAKGGRDPDADLFEV